MRDRNTYLSLPFNPKLKELAKSLRKADNIPEIILWRRLKNKAFNNIDFDRQKIIGNYIVDFFCAERRVVIEIDGSSHDDKQEYDAQRNAFLENLNLTVIHFTADDVQYDINKVMRIIYDHPALQKQLT